jgi:protein TonB
MIRLAEAAAAGGVALALHLAAFALVPPAPGGSTAAGSGGQALVSLLPSDTALTALVQDWTASPAKVAEPEQIKPATPDAVPALPDLAPLAAMATAPAMPTPLPNAQPQVDTAPPPPVPEPTPKPKPKSRPKPQPPADARPAQTASGTGNGTQAGNSGTAQAAIKDTARTASLLAEWGAKIGAKVQRRKAYPRDGRGAAGRVVLWLTVSPDGRLLNVSVRQSSGSPALDQAALRAVKSAGRFARAPSEVTDPAVVELPLRFDP